MKTCKIFNKHEHQTHLNCKFKQISDHKIQNNISFCDIMSIALKYNLGIGCAQLRTFFSRVMNKMFDLNAFIFDRIEFAFLQSQIIQDNR